ncbi:MAG: DIP1984 family protein [Holophagaceae bacterium]|nr:DIP1984 family protein [Holophagaceae bacterium]
MRLAEALHLRKSLAKRIKMDQEALDAALMGRPKAGPSEEPGLLLQQISANHAELESLVIEIYRANAGTLLPSGRTLIETIAHKETVTRRIEHLKALLGRLVAKASREPWPPARAKVQELRLTPQAIRNEINALTMELRELDRSIDLANWSTEVADWASVPSTLTAKAGGF